MELKNLKSGTDIRGTAIDTQAEKADLTAKAVQRLAAAFAIFIKQKTKNTNIKIAVGHDSRLSAKEVSAAAIEGLMNVSSHVIFCSLSSTPAMFMTTVLSECDGAIMLTASHHPKNKNGMKFFSRDGGVSSSELLSIIDIAQALDFSTLPHTDSTFEEGDFLADYCAYMQAFFVDQLGERPLKGLKIAVDASNGSSGFFASRILAPLGADVSASQYLNPDGNFPFHPPNPEDKTAMQSIQTAVLNSKSDIGIIFDTDGDRSAIVLSDGKQINKNRFIALMASIVLKDNPNATIVTDSTTSEGLKHFITEKGGTHLRYKRGYQNVIAKAKQLCDQGINAPLAMETSGHGALKENFFLDDGAYMAAKIIVEYVKLRRQGKDIFDLIKDLKEPAEQTEFRLKLKGDNWKDVGEQVLNSLTLFSQNHTIADDSYEGIRTYLFDGWFMARMSVHDPVVAFNIESEKIGGVEKIKNEITKVLSGCKNIEQV